MPNVRTQYLAPLLSKNLGRRALAWCGHVGLAAPAFCEAGGGAPVGGTRTASGSWCST